MDVSSDEKPGLGPWRSSDKFEDFEPFPDAAVDDSVGARFLAVSASRPDALALSSPAGSWSYSQLRSEALSVAGRLMELVDGADPAPIGIVATHDGPLVVAILGVILSGNIVVVLDALAPDDQVAAVLNEANPVAILHDAAHGAAAVRWAAQTPLVPFDDMARHSVEVSALPPRGPSDPLMLAFTSGTSGTPKGAVITHGVLMNLVRGATNALGITSRDTMPMLFPTSLAVAAYPMFLPLLNGGRLATLDVRSVGLSPIADFLVDERVTLAYMAPTVIRFLVDALNGKSFPDMRMIALGGELVDAEVVRLTSDLFSPSHIAVGFGTTETGVISLYVIEAGASVEGYVPTGYAVPDVELIILDGEGRELPSSESGEVAVSTPYLFAGYWGHPELSDTVLSMDPRGRQGWRLYRTGDLGRLDESGALTVVGRLDNKVKVRGRFVVVGDVEATLHEFDDVVDAVVVPVTRDGVTELAAMVAPASLKPRELRSRMLERDESYRVPSQWMAVDAVPQLPNGKLDRKAVSSLLRGAAGLVDDEAAHDDVMASEAEPSGTSQTTIRILREIWELLLPVEIVGPDDEFLHLGGDSLRAAQMLIMVEDRLGVTVPMGRLIEARTLSQLAAVVEELRTSTSVSSVACVQAGSRDRPRLWFLPDLPGSAYRVRHVAKALGDDQPVWSIESPFLSGEPNPYGSLDGFVRRLLIDIRAAQPEGPYWLCGYSFGGICAYELAQQLVADGADVAFLGVIDVGPGYRGPNWTESHSPPWPYFGVPHPPPADASPADVVSHYREMVRRSPVGALRHLTLRTGLARSLDKHRFRSDIKKYGRVRAEWRLWYAWEQHWQLAVHAWDRTKPYAAPMHLLWADQTGSTDSSMGWGPLVVDLRIVRFDGFHDDLLEERGAPALGKALRSTLDRVMSGS